MDARAKEKELVKRMIAGDESAFEEFAESYIPAIYRFASNRLRGDRELTQEVVQSTVCKVIAKMGSFRGEAALTTWLCACCRNEIAAHFRRRPRHAGEVDFETAEAAGAAGSDLGDLNSGLSEGPEAAVLRREGQEFVHQALDELPQRYGLALEWRYVDNLGVNEIADRLNLGYKAAEVNKLIGSMDVDGESAEDIIRQALRQAAQ